MNTHEQTLTPHAPDYSQDLGRQALIGEETSLEALKQLRHEEAMRTLQWLLDQPAEVIEHSFISPQGSVEPAVAEEADTLRSFSAELVHSVTGMSEQDSAETIADPATFVTTMVTGMADSPKYALRRVITESGYMERRLKQQTITFAVMRPDIPTTAETVISLSGPAYPTDEPIPQKIHIESSLRDSEPGVSILLKQTGTEEPELSKQTLVGGTYNQEVITDPTEKQRYFIALMSDIASGFANHAPEDDYNARIAAGGQSINAIWYNGRYSH